MNEDPAITLNNLWVQLVIASPEPLRNDPRSWLVAEANAYVTWWEQVKLSIVTLVLGADLESWIARYNATRARLMREHPAGTYPGAASIDLLSVPRSAAIAVRNAADAAVDAVEDVATAAGMGLGVVVLVVGGLWLLTRGRR